MLEVTPTNHINASAGNTPTLARFLSFGLAESSAPIPGLSVCVLFAVDAKSSDLICGQAVPSSSNPWAGLSNLKSICFWTVCHKQFVRMELTQTWTYCKAGFGRSVAKTTVVDKVWEL